MLKDLRTFNKALSDFRAVRTLFTSHSNDEEILYICGFHIEQCVEKTLKGYLDFTATGYPRSHSIGDLVRMTENGTSKCIITPWLKIHYSDLTLWEGATRYASDLYLDVQILKEAILNVKEFLKINGVSTEYLPEVTHEVKAKLNQFMPADIQIVEPLYWNVLYKIYGEELGLIQSNQTESPFNMDIYFKAMNVQDKAQEIAKLKAIYNTDDMTVIKREAKHLVEMLKTK